VLCLACSVAAVVCSTHAAQTALEPSGRCRPVTEITNAEIRRSSLDRIRLTIRPRPTDYTNQSELLVRLHCVLYRCWVRPMPIASLPELEVMSLPFRLELARIRCLSGSFTTHKHPHHHKAERDNINPFRVAGVRSSVFGLVCIKS